MHLPSSSTNACVWFYLPSTITCSYSIRSLVVVCSLYLCFVLVFAFCDCRLSPAQHTDSINADEALVGCRNFHRRLCDFNSVRDGTLNIVDRIFLLCEASILSSRLTPHLVSSCRRCRISLLVVFDVQVEIFKIIRNKRDFIG